MLEENGGDSKGGGGRSTDVRGVRAVTIVSFACSYHLPVLAMDQKPDATVILVDTAKEVTADRFGSNKPRSPLTTPCSIFLLDELNYRKSSSSEIK